ncbi:MAG: hypothetical protein KatS3mg115_1119 [Candidatus Poribacteria bacterium]|nr:MAG: hypothetical protein KatS3mg115_1119 [Candidatus Poribacteria bacterium]
MQKLAVWLVTILGLGVSGRASADAIFERGEAAVQVAEQMAEAIRRGDREGFAKLFVPEGQLYERAGVRNGREEIGGLLADRFEGGAPMRLVRPAVVLNAPEIWLFFDWELGEDGEEGTCVARLTWGADGWEVLVADLDGGTLDLPPAGFDPRPAYGQLLEPIETMTAAAIALDAGDHAALQPLLEAESFLFVDDLGREWVGPGALVQMAFTPIPEALNADAMRLLVSPPSRRAIAYQRLEDRRVSLQLERRAGAWKIVAASLSRPLETLPVSPEGLKATTWGQLRSEEESH